MLPGNVRNIYSNILHVLLNVTVNISTSDEGFSLGFRPIIHVPSLLFTLLSTVMLPAPFFFRKNILENISDSILFLQHTHHIISRVFCLSSGFEKKNRKNSFCNRDQQLNWVPVFIVKFLPIMWLQEGKYKTPGTKMLLFNAMILKISVTSMSASFSPTAVWGLVFRQWTVAFWPHYNSRRCIAETGVTVTPREQCEG